MRASFGHMPRLRSGWILAWACGWLGMQVVWASRAVPATLDQTRTVYAAAIAPILQARCIRCHGAEKVKGALRLDTPAGIRTGGSGGPCLEMGDAANSELYIRITLPADDEDHMPSQGDPLPPEQVELVRWWLDQGASFEDTLAESSPPDSIRATLSTLQAGLAASAIRPSPAPEPVHHPAAWHARREAAMDALRARGAVAAPLCADSTGIAINFSVSSEEISDNDLAMLAPLAAEIVSLDLAGTAISDAGLNHLAGLSALTRLHLERTAVTDAGLARLGGLTNLAYLNLVSTETTDAGLIHLEQLPGLKSLYLWQTRVTADGARRLRQAREAVEVMRGWDDTARE